jgi:hypothetical protein
MAICLYFTVDGGPARLGAHAPNARAVGSGARAVSATGRQARRRAVLMLVTSGRVGRLTIGVA